MLKDQAQNVLDYIEDLLCQVDANHVIHYVSPSVVRTLGYTSEQALNTSLLKWVRSIHPEDRRLIRQRLRARTRGEEVEARAEFRFRHAEGHYIWLETNSRVMKDESGCYAGLLFVARDTSARHETRRQLDESRRMYERLINSIDAIVCQCNPDNAQTFFISPQVERILGYTPEECTGDPLFWKKVIPPGDYERMLRLLQGIRVIGGYTAEYPAIAKDGRVVWLRDIAHVLRTGGTDSAVTILIDITAQREMQETERQQRELAEVLRDSAAALTSTLQLEEVFTQILHHVSRIVPHDTANIMLIDNGVAQVHHEINKPGLETARVQALTIAETPTLQMMIDTGQPLIIDDVRTYGSWMIREDHFWLRAYAGIPIRLNETTIGFLNLNSADPNAFTPAHVERLGAFADQIAMAVRNAKQFAEMETRVQVRTTELNLERDHLKLILNASGEGIIQIEQNQIAYVNHRLTEMTGYSAEELIGQPLDILRSPQSGRPHLSPFSAERIYPTETWRGDVLLRRKEGGDFFAGLTISRLSGSDAQRAVIVVRDISREKALEAQKARFVSNASHELRTPITNLTTRLHLLRRRPDKLDDHLVVLDQVAATMRNLVNDLLDMGRFERGEISLRKQLLPLRPVVESVINVQRQEIEDKSLTLTTTLAAEAMLAEIDPERLRQVLTNLLTNAIRYTPAEGKIHIELSLMADGKHASVLIRDTGIGIAAEHLPHLFQPFYRATDDVNGTGLGLAIARDIILLHRGDISVESTFGEGSTFTIQLPVVTPVGR